MAHNYSTQRNRRITPQTEVIPGREQDMAENNAGGYSFVLDKWKTLDRFLILGAESGTYYVAEKDLSKANLDNSIACIKENPKKVLDKVVEISTAGRAPKNDQAILMLALLFTECKDDEVKKEVALAFPEVCRIGTHLFTFCNYLDDMRSWGCSVRKAVSNWYTMEPGKLEYQLIKYKGRTVEGTKNQWTHRDVLRSAHVKPVSEKHNALFKYAVKGEMSEDMPLIKAYEELATTKDTKRAVELIKAHKIPHDSWPTEMKNVQEIWKAGLPDMPLTALIRNLGKLSSIGILAQGKFDDLELVIKKLTNQEYIKKSRVHPLNVLVAQKTYASGQGFKGSSSWTPVRKIVDALEQTFYLSFGNIEPTGKRMLLALDVSGSMSSAIPGAPVLSCAEGTACMSMVTARVEKRYEIMGFANSFKNLGISPAMSFTECLERVRDNNFGSTDCSLPIVWADKNDLEFDTFCIYTDCETYAGSIHPTQALAKYRKKVPDAKLIVVGMASTEFTIADPADAGQLDVVGFDTATPQIISEFSRGNI